MKPKSEFEIKLIKAVTFYIKTQKNSGIIGMSFDCFIQSTCHLPHLYGFENAEGCPRGTNHEWLFRGIMRDVLKQNKNLNNFITD